MLARSHVDEDATIRMVIMVTTTEIYCVKTTKCLIWTHTDTEDTALERSHDECYGLMVSCLGVLNRVSITVTADMY